VSSVQIVKAGLECPEIAEGPDSDDLRRSFHKMTVPSGDRFLLPARGSPFSLNGSYPDLLAGLVWNWVIPDPLLLTDVDSATKGDRIEQWNLAHLNLSCPEPHSASGQ
jgi:hypothetical protein